MELRRSTRKQPTRKPRLVEQPEPEVQPEAQPECTHILDVPDDCLVRIMSYLDEKSISRASQTCKRLYAVLRDSRLFRHVVIRHDAPDSQLRWYAPRVSAPRSITYFGQNHQAPTVLIGLLAKMRKFRNLKRLVIHDSKLLCSYLKPKIYSVVEELEINNCGITPAFVNKFLKCNKLKRLVLDDSNNYAHIFSKEDLAKCSNLQEVAYCHRRSYINIKVLSALPNLKRLEIIVPHATIFLDNMESELMRSLRYIAVRGRKLKELSISGKIIRGGDVTYRRIADILPRLRASAAKRRARRKNRRRFGGHLRRRPLVEF